MPASTVSGPRHKPDSVQSCTASLPGFAGEVPKRQRRRRGPAHTRIFWLLHGFPPRIRRGGAFRVPHAMQSLIHTDAEGVIDVFVVLTPDVVVFGVQVVVGV